MDGLFEHGQTRKESKESMDFGKVWPPLTCTTLGICIVEEPENEELQLMDVSLVTTKGRVTLHIKCGKYKNVVWARVFPHMQKQEILGMF